MPEERTRVDTDTFTYKANDGKLNANTATVKIDILPPNHAPSILSQAPTAASPNLEYLYAVRAVDPDAGETLTFTLTQSPTGMTIDGATGLIRWTPTATQLGHYVVVVKVTDSQGESALQGFMIVVSTPVTVPNVVGLTLSAAQSAIVAAHLAVGTIPTVPSNTVPAGNVVSQEPTAGTTDSVGNQLTEKDPLGRIATKTYDGQRNVLTSTDFDGSTTTYTYNNRRQVLTIRDPEGRTTSNVYDANGNLIQVTDPEGGVTRYTYDAAGNRLQIIEAGPATTGRTVSYTYDAVYRLTQEAIDEPGTANDQTITYSYDAVDNRTQMNRDGAITTYTYDANGRLLTETSSAGTLASTYDNNGNLKTRSNGASTDAYTYDAENRLISVRVQSGANPGPVSYTYDADGMRTSKTAGGVTTTFLLDKNQPYAQVVVETIGGTVATYTYGHDLISQTRPGVGARFSQYDGQRSTRQLTGPAGGITDAYTYDAFGVMLIASGTTPNVYLYTGEQLDPNVGSYYLRARDYNQATGRFLSYVGWVTTHPATHQERKIPCDIQWRLQTSDS